MGERRLLLFLDGSTNTAAGAEDIISTNVVRLCKALTYGSGIPQISFYFSGVGTRRDTVSGATGQGFDEIVTDAYVNLSANYLAMDEVHDSIYIFGFSRGAAAARALSGLLSDPGLMPIDYLENFPTLWQYFLCDPDDQAKRGLLRERLEGRLVRAEVRFLGAFDTVAGTDWDLLQLFSTVRFQDLHLAKSVRSAVQILALDDDRVPSFAPLLWDKHADTQNLEQIWMPGVHADVGGCSDGRFLGNIALLTMIDRAKKYCPELEWDEDYIADVIKETNDARNVCVTSERPGILRKILLSGQRQVGEHGRAQGESLHPIYEWLVGREIVMKGRTAKYGPHELRQNLPVIALESGNMMRSACELVLGGM